MLNSFDHYFHMTFHYFVITMLLTSHVLLSFIMYCLSFQVIPLHLPPGDTSTERTLKIEGTPEQIESAKQMVNQVISGEVCLVPILFCWIWLWYSLFCLPCAKFSLVYLFDFELYYVAIFTCFFWYFLYLQA